MQKKVNIRNRKVRFNFELIEKFNAGIQLFGTEIKSIRESRASIAESFCQFKDGELYIVNMTIDEYFFGNQFNHQPKRERKLLLNRKELQKIEKKVKNSGLTIVPLVLYMNEKGLAKLQISIAKGKKMHDKRQAIKSKDLARDMQKEIKNV